MYDRILVPTDGSDVARVAAETGISFAKRFGAEVHGIYVRDPDELPAGSGTADGESTLEPGDATLQDLSSQAEEAGIDVQTAVVEADEPIHESILRYAAENDVDCVVMGTHGRTGVGRYVLGSVAEQTVRESPVPVVTVHGETRVDPEFESVLVPTDGSDSAMAAADHAIELAMDSDATLHVLHAVDTGVVWSDVDTAMVIDALEEAGRQALDAVIDRAEAAGVDVIESSLSTGSPYRAIVDYAEENDVSTIVMGTHGRTGIQRYLLGSVAERVVRLSDVPVITVKESQPDE